MENYQDNQSALLYIVNKIKSGDLKIGDRLPSERELTETLSISRSSTREAISILSGMGLIESRHGSGNYVCNHTEETIKQVVDLMLSLGSISQKDLIDYRMAISLSVGTFLIQRGLTYEEERELKSIIEEMRTASDEEFCKLDRRFHLGLINATGNALFMTVMEPVGELYLDMIVHVIMSSSNRDRDIRVPMHENILKSIIDRDLDACLRYMREHYDYVERRLNGEK